MLLFCLLLLLATTFTVQGEAPKVTSATKYVKEYSIFGETVRVGIMEIEFDQELYLLRALPRACEGSCSTVTEAEAAQRFADTCTPDFCVDFPEVPLDTPTNISRTPASGAPGWWTANVHAVTNCSVNVLRLMPLQPGANVLTYDEETGGSVVVWSSLVGVRHQLYCSSPGSALEGQAGIDYVGVWDANQYLISDYNRVTSMIADLYQQPVVAPVEPVECILPSPYNSTHVCLQPGIEYDYERSDTDILETRYAIPVPTGCFTLTAYTLADVMWISDSEPYQDGLTIYPDSTTALWEPRPFHLQEGFDEQETTFTRSFCLEGEGQQYIWAYERSNPSGGLFPYVVTRFDINLVWVDNIPFSELTPAAFGPSLLNGVTLTLADGSKKFTNFHEEAPLFTTYDTGIMNIRALWPSENPSFYANLHWAMRYDARFGLSTDSRQYPLVPNKFAVGVLLDQDFDLIYNLNYVLPRKHQYLTVDEFMNANLTLHGTFGNADKETVYTTLTASDFTVKAITCEPEAFYNISTQIKQYLAAVLTANADINSLAFTIDMLAQEDVYVACFNEMMARTNQTDGPVFKYTTSSCLFEFGTEEFATDPCCNISISLYQTCGAIVKDYTYPVLQSVDVSVFEDVCADPYCAQLNTLKLADEYNRINAPDGCSSRLPQLTTFLNSGKEVLYNCRAQYLNSRADHGLPCTHDVDCPNGTLCSSLGYGCLVDQDTALLNYLQCALDSMSEFLKHTLADTIAVNYTDLSASTVRDSFLLDACVDPAGYKLGAFTRLFVGSCEKDDQCEGGYMFDTMDSAWYRNDCYYGCSRTNKRNAIGALCGNYFCNYDETVCVDDPTNETACIEECLTTPGYGINSQFCGICDNENDCDPNVPAGLTNEPACTTAVVCILNNGTRIITATADDCTNMMTCQDGTFTDEDSCLNQYHCTDSTDYALGLFVGSFAEGGELDSTQGICQYNVTLPYPWNQNVQFCNGYTHTYVTFCIDPTVPRDQCHYNSTSFPGYVINYIEWMVPATNQSYCERYSGCYGPPVQSPGPADDWLAQEVQCTDPKWTWKKFYNWEQTNTWRGGQVRRPQWKTRTVAPRWTSGKVFAHENWFAAYQAVLTVQYNQYFQSFVYCQHSRTVELLDRLVCNCKVGDNDTSCASEDFSALTDIGTVCGGGESTLVATPFSFSFPSDSISGTNCETLYFTAESIYTFQDSTDKPHLSNVVINFDEDSTWALRNQNDAIWGKVLTDGIFVNTTDGVVATFINVSLSVRMSLDRLNPDMNDFPILDLAYANGTSLVLYALDQNVTVGADRFSYELTTAELVTNRTYYVVQRVEDWDTLSRTVFSHGEIAYIAVILFLYILLLFLAFFKLGRSIYIMVSDSGKLPMSRLLTIMCLIATFTVFRVVLFAILLSQQIVNVTSGGLYVLIEFPILLYFVYVTNYIIMWAYIRRNSNKLKGFKKGWVTAVNAITILLNLFILALFVVIIILYEEVVGDPEPICQGEVVVWNKNAADIIGLVYRCVFGGIDITIGIAFIFVGYMFSEVLHSMSSNQEDMRRKVLAVSIVGSCGLIAQGIVWIVFPAIGQTQSNYLSLSILIVVEIIPTAIFLLLIRERSIRATATSARSATRSKAGASKKTSASSKVSSGSF